MRERERESNMYTFCERKYFLYKGPFGMKKIISPLREQRPIQKTEDKHLEGIEAHLDISINKTRI